MVNPGNHRDMTIINRWPEGLESPASQVSFLIPESRLQAGSPVGSGDAVAIFTCQ
jgi:hypothetical protein